MLQYSFGIETKVDPSTWSRENLKHDIQESEWSAKIQKQDIVKSTRYPYYINLNSCNFKCRSSKYTSPILNKKNQKQSLILKVIIQNKAQLNLGLEYWEVLEQKNASK